jgi:hypothetical protein
LCGPVLRADCAVGSTRIVDALPGCPGRGTARTPLRTFSACDAPGGPRPWRGMQGTRVGPHISTGAANIRRAAQCLDALTRAEPNAFPPPVPPPALCTSSSEFEQQQKSGRVVCAGGRQFLSVPVAVPVLDEGGPATSRRCGRGREGGREAPHLLLIHALVRVVACLHARLHIEPELVASASSAPCTKTRCHPTIQRHTLLLLPRRASLYSSP